MIDPWQHDPDRTTRRETPAELATAPELARREQIAADHAVQMRAGRRRLRGQIRTLAQRHRVRIATRAATLTVLRESDDRQDLRDAADTLTMLEVEHHAERLRADAEALRAEGATISDRMIAVAATRLGESTAARKLAELDDNRRADNRPGL